MTLTVSPRETRLVVERNLMLLGVPTGALAAVGEVVADAELLGLGGLAFLRSAHERDRRWATPSLAGDRSVRADGIAAPYAAPALLDLLVAITAERAAPNPKSGEGISAPTCRSATKILPPIWGEARATVQGGGEEVAPGGADGDSGGHSLEVHGLYDAGMLGALVPQAAAFGVALEIRTEGARTLLTARPAARSGPLAHRRRAIDEGIAVDAELWWWLYHRSNEALSDDTEASRTHAGATASPDAAPADGDHDPDYLPTRTKEHA